MLAAPVRELVTAYRRAAAAHAVAVAAGRHRAANREFDDLTLLGREMQSRGRDGEHALKGLLTDEDNAVRTWAATHSLTFATALAEEVLASVANGPPSPTRLIAEQTLLAWQRGRL
jgi:hypothetical protein